MRDLPNYDAWLEEPYQRREDFGECPECGCTLDGDKRNREVWCACCGFEDGFDWDSEAERREEARAEARAERYEF